MHYAVDAGPPPPPPTPDEQPEPSPCSTTAETRRCAWHRPKGDAPARGGQWRGLRQDWEPSLCWQKYLCLLLTSALKLMPKLHVQSIDLFQNDSGHVLQGCFSLLTFRDPKLLNHDGVSKGITWGGAGQFSNQQPRQRESILWQVCPALCGVYTHLSGATQRYGVSSDRITAPTGQTFGSRDWRCDAVAIQSQLLQAHSFHKSKVVTSSPLQTSPVTYPFLLLKQTMCLLDSAFGFPFWLARFLSLPFQGGSLCLFFSPYVLNNCREKNP